MNNLWGGGRTIIQLLLLSYKRRNYCPCYEKNVYYMAVALLRRGIKKEGDFLVTLQIWIRNMYLRFLFFKIGGGNFAFQNLQE